MALIRPSRDADVSVLAAIYEHHVLFGTGTFETEAPSVNEMSARRADVLSKGLPYLVAEENGAIAGFAYANCLNRGQHIVIQRRIPSIWLLTCNAKGLAAHCLPN